MSVTQDITQDNVPVNNDSVDNVPGMMTRSRSSSVSHVGVSVPTETPQSNFQSDFDEQSSAIITIKNLLNTMKPEGDFQSAILQVVNFLADSHLKLRSDYVSLKNQYDTVNRRSGANAISVAKTEQYSRRDTVVVTGVKFNTEEKPLELQQKIASELSKCGVPIDHKDFSAVHRNSRTSKTITVKKDNKDRTITVPPSVTVRFMNSNKKDNLIRTYRNYEFRNEQRIHKPVKVFQSMTPYYSDLKRDISLYLKDEGFTVRWIHWRSPTMGMAIKFSKENEPLFIKNVHCIDDMIKRLDVLCPYTECQDDEGK